MLNKTNKDSTLYCANQPRQRQPVRNHTKRQFMKNTLQLMLKVSLSVCARVSESRLKHFVQESLLRVIDGTVGYITYLPPVTTFIAVAEGSHGLIWTPCLQLQERGRKKERLTSTISSSHSIQPRNTLCNAQYFQTKTSNEHNQPIYCAKNSN